MTPLDALGAIDVYLFDQLQRGRIRPGMRILDAGCGGGRNVHYFLGQGYDVTAVDADPRAVAAVRERAAAIPGARCETHVADLAALPLPDASFDAVVCSAVLHFARDEAHFRAMLDELWRVLAPGGVLFTRLASTIGLGGRSVPLAGRRHRLPDGTERFVVDRALLQAETTRLGATLLDPVKTTLVEDLRAMTTWVVGKAG